MQHKRIYAAAIIFFLLVNTTYFWEGKMGLNAFPAFVILIIYFLALAGIFLNQLFKAISEKPQRLSRRPLLLVLAFVLATAFLYPGGLFDFQQFETKSLLIATREGAANCRTTLNFRVDQTFVERNVCFGVTESSGTYRVSGDTVFFEYTSVGRHETTTYAFGLIEKTYTGSFYLGNLVRYENASDTNGTELWITKNDLVTASN